MVKMIHRLIYMNLIFREKKNLVYKHKLENSEQSRSQLEAVVEYVDKYCKADGVKNCRIYVCLRWKK